MRLFESGNLYLEEGPGRYAEPQVLALAACGAATGISPHVAERPLDFFDLKGDVETLLDLFEHKQVYFDGRAGVDYYHPGRCARAVLDGETVARFGALHPRVTAARKLRMPVLVAELLLDRLLRRPLRVPRFQALPRVPVVDRDLSLLAPVEVRFEQVLAAARGAGIEALADVLAVEVGRAPAPPGKYTLLLRLVFQRADQTLSDVEVNQWTQAIAQALEHETGLVLRT